MSLNLMSLIGVGRVGLRPNSDDVTNYTLFFLKSSLSYQNLSSSTPMKSYNTSKASEGYLPVCGGLVWCISIVN